MADIHYRSTEELEAGLEEVRRSPKDEGAVKLIVRRPDFGVREILDEGRLDANTGLVGDNWSTRGSSRTADGSSHPRMQVNIMNARAAALVAVTSDRWALAGDQLYVDMDLSGDNLPPGTRLALGTAVLEVTEIPHTGCRKFVERFGKDAMALVNSPVGRVLNLRGINARVAQPGTFGVGDTLRKLAPDA